ncbi:MAG TPA: aminoacetone oxidase family FAD-binding enzyme, partial [Eubacteriaceae bacterium]|nr:aminoacetone oxidase family FAD-binding enzyme [Eubacteriaceae bacterium]
SAEKGKSVLLIDQNEKCGKKLFITGKGRCNLTNDCDVEDFFDHVVKNPKFLYSAIYQFTNDQTIRFFNDLGLATKVERGARVFPKSDKSSDVIKALEKYMKQNDVTLSLQTKALELVASKGRIQGVRTDRYGLIECKHLIVATGGVTYTQTGSTGDGYRFAKSVGHRVVKPEGHLIPLVSREDTKPLQGLALKNVSISLYRNQKKVNESFGEMLFTHFGLSGPEILTMSSYMDQKGSYEIAIDLKPALDEKKLDLRILRDFEAHNNKALKNSLNKLLPARLIELIIERSRIHPDKKVNQIDKVERQNLLHTIKNLRFQIESKVDVNQGIITAGGVSVSEIDPSTMESKKVQGLYFAGEVLDVDALTGGFNLQIAFSTGYLAGWSIQEIQEEEE